MKGSCKSVNGKFKFSIRQNDGMANDFWVERRWKRSEEQELVLPVKSQRQIEHIVRLCKVLDSLKRKPFFGNKGPEASRNKG